MARKSRKNIEITHKPDSGFPVFNAAEYIRLSYEDRKKKGDSIETQQKIINEFVAMRDRKSVV